MAKKRKKKKKKRNKIVDQTPPSPSPSREPAVEVKEKKEKKNHTKILFYIIPISVALISVVVFLILRSPQSEVIRSSDLNILLITLDTTRADRIGCYGYEKAKTPNLDSLALSGVKFSNAYCQVPLTLPSHCSILTGTYPIYHQVHNNGFYYLSPDFTTLGEILKERGFKTAAFVSSFTVDSRFGMDQGFDLFDDKFGEDEVMKNLRSERRAEKVFNSFSQWFEENSGQRFFCWLHFYDPHLPYYPPSPYKEEFSEEPYDGEIAYMDHYVGKTVEALRDKNILDNTLVILAGDHGEALGEKNEIDHGLFIYDVTMKVPFIIYAPQNLPQNLEVDTRVRLIDIMPTILDMLKIPIHAEIQGASLLPIMNEKKVDDLPSYIETYSPREHYGWSELIGLIDGEWKYIQAPKPELYNLTDDPQETQNVIQNERNVAADMKESLENMIQSLSSGKEAGKREITPEEEERLRSLGYIGSPSDRQSGKQLPDPKDKAAEYSLRSFGKKYETQGEYQKAEEYYKELLRLEPDVPWSYINLGYLYSKMERIDDAIQILEQGKEIIPDSFAILSRLSKFYWSSRKPQEALETSQAVLKINPRYFDAMYVAGNVLSGMRRWAEAIDNFEKAIEIEPENKALQLRYAFSLVSSGRREEGMEIYERMKQENPDDFRIYQDIGIFYDSMGEMDKALENIKRTVEINPSPMTYFNYALILNKAGDLKEAIRYLSLYLETTPDKASPRRNKAESLLQLWQSRLQ